MKNINANLDYIISFNYKSRMKWNIITNLDYESFNYKSGMKNISANLDYIISFNYKSRMKNISANLDYINFDYKSRMKCFHSFGTLTLFNI